MKVLKIVPNTITSFNLFFGSVGVVLALQGRPDLTAWCVLIASFFDFTDGFAARMLKAYSDIGKELDSLADLISFGLAPATSYMSLLHFHFSGSWNFRFFERSPIEQSLLILPLVLTIFSALRLAKFNIDTRQTESFLGLTTTATGMFSVSMIHLVFTRGGEWIIISSPYVVYPLIIIFCALLVSEIPMFSLKFKTFNIRNNFLRYLLLIVGLIGIISFGIGGIAVTILGYVLFSIGLYMIKRK
jgi:CDP-diacylglycerol--serine O-phosphatidyltransferase